MNPCMHACFQANKSVIAVDQTYRITTLKPNTTSKVFKLNIVQHFKYCKSIPLSLSSAKQHFPKVAFSG